MEYQIIQNEKIKYKQYNVNNNKKIKSVTWECVCVHTGAICMQICLSVTNDESSYSLWMSVCHWINRNGVWKDDVTARWSLQSKQNNSCENYFATLSQLVSCFWRPGKIRFSVWWRKMKKKRGEKGFCLMSSAYSIWSLCSVWLK